MNWKTLRDAPHDEWMAWAQTQSWFQAMAACQQDARWHAEGDVATHTQRVLEALPSLEAWPQLDCHERAILRCTALLHDVAKPLTTEVDSATGQVRSPKHAVRGELMARRILRDLGCDVPTREAIARMVRFHGRPVFVMDRDQPIHEVVRLSWLVTNRLLDLFALADAQGRDTDTQQQRIQDLDFFKILAQEANCYESAYPFENEQSRFTFYRASQPDLHYVSHEAPRCTVTMLCGLPGSGKDHWIAQHRGDWPVVALDAVRDTLGVKPDEDQGRVAQHARELCREHLRVGTSFVFNATNTLRATRARWIDLFANYSARIECVYIEPPLETILLRNRQRERTVPEPVIRRLAERLEPPTWAECHRLELVTDEPV